MKGACKQQACKPKSGHCVQRAKTFEDELIARLRQISLTSTLNENSYMDSRMQGCNRLHSAPKPLLKTECWSAVPTNTRTNPLQRSFGTTETITPLRSRCVHLCIIGKKMVLHSRIKEQVTFLERARNYSRLLKKRQQEQANRHFMNAKQNRATANVASKGCSNNACQPQIPTVRLPQTPGILRSDSPQNIDSRDSKQEHRYAVYHRSSLENSEITVLLPRDIPCDSEARRLKAPWSSNLDTRIDSGCVSHLSFASVDLTATCRTPDDGSSILSPCPGDRQGLYPVACPAYPMNASFPICVIPEPDVF